MSKASRQTIALLAVVNGVFITIEEFNLAPELVPTTDWGRKVCKDCIDVFPETGNRKKNLEWMTDRLHKIDDYLNNVQKTFYTITVLVNLAHLIMTDLLERIKDKKKREILIPVMEVVDGLSDQIDPEKNIWAAYEEADRMLVKLYEYLEFS
jgi:hypothetical protein